MQISQYYYQASYLPYMHTCVCVYIITLKAEGPSSFYYNMLLYSVRVIIFYYSHIRLTSLPWSSLRDSSASELGDTTRGEDAT